MASASEAAKMLRRNQLACCSIVSKSPDVFYGEYQTYSAKKKSANASPLSFDDFVALSVVNATPKFLFIHTKFAYGILTGDDNVISAANFKKFAPYLTPLASRWDADKIFEQLAEDVPDEKTGTTKRCITFNNFNAYVGTLKAGAEAESWRPNFRVEFGLDQYDQVLFIQENVSDGTSIPSWKGRVLLTTHFFIFEAQMTKKVTKIHWNDIDRIEFAEPGVLTRVAKGLKISYRTPESASTSFKVDVEDPEPTTDRRYLHNYLNSWLLAHRLANQHCSFDARVRKYVLEQVFDNILRMRALRTMMLPNRYVLDASLMKVDAKPDANDSLVLDMRKYVSSIMSDTHGTGFNVDRFIKALHLTDAAPSQNAAWDPAVDVTSATQGAREREVRRRMEESKQAVSKKALEANIATFKQEISVFDRLFDRLLGIIQWRNKPLTGSLLLFFLWIGITNQISFLPGYFFLAHTILLAVCLKDPEILDRLFPPVLAEVIAEKAKLEAPRNGSISAPAAEPRRTSLTDSSSPPAIPVATVAGSSTPPPVSAIPVAQVATGAPSAASALKTGFLEKIANIKDMYNDFYSGVDKFQNWLRGWNIVLMKIKGIYFWRSHSASEGVLVFSAIISLVLLVVPFKITYFCLVGYIFTVPLRDPRSPIDRIYEEIPLPDDAPDGTRFNPDD